MLAVLKVIAVLLTVVHFLGPWGSLALVAVITTVFWAVRANSDRLLEMVIDSHARSMGKVMKDVSVMIHSVTAATEPDPSVWRTGDDEEDDAFEEQLAASGMPEGNYDWFKVDATITPKPEADGSPATWDTAMLMLKKVDSVASHALEFDMDCIKAEIEIWQDGKFVTVDYGATQGPARVRLYVGVVPGVLDVQFTYLGETFGAVRLPRRSHVLA